MAGRYSLKATRRPHGWQAGIRKHASKSHVRHVCTHLIVYTEVTESIGCFGLLLLI